MSPPDFWFNRLKVNARQAIFHQWEQLEASGCIENFRIAAGEVEGFREGWFFADSDAYKWLDAASRIWATSLDARLAALIDAFIPLLARAQMADGYLFTYNQIHFPGTRWQNLQIEHELYCHGHLIEAGVAHFLATGRMDLLAVAHHAADRIVADFQGKGPAYTPGHEEIEIALIRLHNITPGDTVYLDLARQFIEQRGRTPHFALAIFRQNIQVGQRSKAVQQQKQAYLAAHPDWRPFQIPASNPAKKPVDTTLRWYASALSGKYFQQHTPVREQTIPVGHSVRFAYLETAVAMLARASRDQTLFPALEKAWEHMLTRRMYITGGVGSLPGLEGFGQDDELNPEYAYAETCAALGCMFWNWEMAQLTGEAKYSDLLEWQLYNAAGVGMGQDGQSYFYNNPLACRGEVTRRAWYAIPCCPSNLSRTLASLNSYSYSSSPGGVYVHQYISCEGWIEMVPCSNGGSAGVRLVIESQLPWEGQVRIQIAEVSCSLPDQAAVFALHLRVPGWAAGMTVAINGNPLNNGVSAPPEEARQGLLNAAPASGYDPRLAYFFPVSRAWSSGDVIELSFTMPVQPRCAHPRVKVYRGKAALTRGPLVYCLESLDNPHIDIFTARFDPNSLEPVFDPALLGGVVKIQGKTKEGKPLTFIPYFLWGNRGPSHMTVWVGA